MYEVRAATLHDPVVKHDGYFLNERHDSLSCKISRLICLIYFNRIDCSP